MHIKAIGGLFENHAALNHAMQELALRGYPHDSYSVMALAVAPSTPPLHRSKGLLRALARLGVGGEQADFYVDGIQRGGVLLVLHGIEAQRLSDVQRMLKQQGARFYPQR